MCEERNKPWSGPTSRAGNLVWAALMSAMAVHNAIAFVDETSLGWQIILGVAFVIMTWGAIVFTRRGISGSGHKV